MKLFLRYLQSKLGVILLFLAFGAILAFSFVLYRLPAEAVLYPAALCVLLFLPRPAPPRGAPGPEGNRRGAARGPGY